MKNLFAVKDELEGFGSPIVASNKAKAMLIFGDEIQHPDSMLNKHPENYSLYALGQYNEETGEIISKVEYLDKAVNYVQKKS